MQIKLVDRLARRISLSPLEMAFLQSLSRERVRFRKGELIHSAGRPADRAYFLERGWAMAFSDFPDGSRQSRLLNFPGDLVGMPSMAMNRHAATTEAITDVEVVPFPKQAVFGMIQSYPRLASIFFIFAQQERVTLGDRLCSISRLSCKGRMAFLVMDMLTRLRVADQSITNQFEMHLTRELMGEITAMTPVHASRMWSELIADGAISYERPFVIVRNEAFLIAISSFVDRSADLDFSSVPAESS